MSKQAICKGEKIFVAAAMRVFAPQKNLAFLYHKMLNFEISVSDLFGIAVFGYLAHRALRLLQIPTPVPKPDYVAIRAFLENQDVQMVATLLRGETVDCVMPYVQDHKCLKTDLTDGSAVYTISGEFFLDALVNEIEQAPEIQLRRITEHTLIHLSQLRVCNEIDLGLERWFALVARADGRVHEFLEPHHPLVIELLQLERD